MERISWNYCQENSDQILADGLLTLCESGTCLPTEMAYSDFGNYLVSHMDKHYYIGEARDLKARVKQQFNPKTSTFYKNYLKTENPKKIPISAFSIQFIPTQIGRKEIEDFGIVNLATPLNKFQIGKRDKIVLNSQNGLWERVQNQKKELLEQGEEQIFNQIFSNWFDNSVNSTADPLYIVKQDEVIIYIGKSPDINERHKTHSTTTYFSALRRHIGTNILGYELQERKGKNKYFEVNQDKSITNFLKETKAVFHPVNFGRYELEEYLIKMYKPLLNRKDNIHN